MADSSCFPLNPTVWAADYRTRDMAPVKGRITQSWSVKCRDSELGYVALLVANLGRKMYIETRKLQSEAREEYHKLKKVSDPDYAVRLPLHMSRIARIQHGKH